MEIDDGRHITANYSTFRVSDEPSLYVLTVTGYSGKTGRKSNEVSEVALLLFTVFCHLGNHMLFETTVFMKYYSPDRNQVLLLSK